MVARQDDYGSGGPDGIILPLDAVSTGSFEMAYTLPVSFGASSQTLSLQIDTGSSDLWVTSSQCGTENCRASPRFDPAESIDTGSPPFSITYLKGQVSGPVVWDRVTMGGYSVDNQAFSPADAVDNEPLGPKFAGILGLSLPLNSIIAANLPPKVNNEPDGAVLASNLFSITPTTNAPSQRFFSISLSRPDSSLPKALLGIGRHPPEYLTDPRVVRYLPLISERRGTHFWKVNVQSINVFVDGEDRAVDIGNSVNGGVFPSAVLDSGVPVILTSSAIANGIYGAIGIGPANDGQYYLPCTMPLNVSFTFDNNVTIPLHPLDLTGTPPRAQDSSVCIGLIQSADSVLAVPNNAIGDMVLGVPFMRSIYMVMSYYVPDLQTGVINPAAYTRAVDPRVGLLNLTDPHQAMDDFNTVRVLQRPLEENHNTTPPNRNAAPGGGKNIAVPVVIGVVSFFALCFVLFFLRWWMMRRRFKKEQQTQRTGGEAGQAGGFLARLLANPQGSDAGRYGLAKQGQDKDIALGQLGGATLRNPARDSTLSEDELRKIKFDAYMRNSYRTDSSASIYDATMVDTFNKQDDAAAGEFGVRRRPMKDRVASDYLVQAPETDYDEAWDPRTALNWGKGSQSGFPVSRSPDPTGRYSPAHNRGETVSVPLLSASPSPPPSPRTQLPPGVSLPESPELPSTQLSQSSALRHAKDDTGVTEEGTTESRTTCGLAGVGTAGRRDGEHPKFDHGRYAAADVSYQGPR